jgi:hypothetical protein
VSATVFFQNAAGNEIATLENIFDDSGVPTDPNTVSCVVTDPLGNAVTHTYAGAVPADITRKGAGDYTLQVPCTLTGLWGYVWIGTGQASDVQVGTWRVGPSLTVNQFYTSVEEVKQRLNITDSESDFQIQAAVPAAARAIEAYCGRHFYPLAETRTFVPYTIYMLPLDDLVSVTSFKVDRDGDGVFEETWVQGTDYELAYGPDEYNQNASGEARPYTIARTINAMGGGLFFPYTWEFSRLDRIQVTGTWGWPQVPYGVQEAAAQTAAEIFKLKDSPFGLAGTSEFGMIRVPAQNPYIVKLLCDYINPRRKIGI